MGPLAGVRVLEMEAVGPIIHAGMLLADLGAEVVRVARATTRRTGHVVEDPNAAMLRGRTQVSLDLKDPVARASCFELVRAADVLLEGARPGVMERLGLGPDECLEVNPGLVYGRLSGWGQSGPMAALAGHDINYVALAGALEPMGPPGAPPLPPLNYVGNFGGGSMYLLVGVLSALHERSRTGRGQVVDAAMLDGASTLTALLRSWQHAGHWSPQRGTNVLDGSAPYYRVYACADGRHMAVGAIEDVFYGRLVQGLGLDIETLPDRSDRDCWPALTETFTAAFAARTRDQWEKAFRGIDACVTPVLSLAESAEHPHAVARGAFVETGGVTMPAPGPRLSSVGPPPPALVHGDVAAVLDAWRIRSSGDGEPAPG